MFTTSAQMSRGDKRFAISGWSTTTERPTKRKSNSPTRSTAYVLQLRLRNPDAMRAEAERLFEEVIADFGDVPLRTQKYLELEALLKEPTPSWNGKPLTTDERRQLAELVGLANGHSPRSPGSTR